MIDAELHRRLAALGLGGVEQVRIHHNRIVMLSLKGGILRLHAGYTHAPDSVLAAIVRFLRPWTRRKVRKAAEREFLAFPVDHHAPSRPRPRRARPVPAEDRPMLDRLAAAHRRLNAQHFGGALGEISLRISARMRTRLGEVVLAPGRVPGEIAISRRHLCDPWPEVEHTLLHEMIHQWQAENGLPVDHGPGFRSKARAVGVLPRARQPARSPGIGGMFR